MDSRPVSLENQFKVYFLAMPGYPLQNAKTVPKILQQMGHLGFHLFTYCSIKRRMDGEILPERKSFHFSFWLRKKYSFFNSI
jgi:hypothetical protein